MNNIWEVVYSAEGIERRYSITSATINGALAKANKLWHDEFPDVVVTRATAIRE